MASEVASYVEHALTLAVSGWEIPAALTLPPGERSVVPSAVLLVPGSLFSDVNGDYPAWSVFPHVYAHLARQIAERGHAVYRFAKLGPGTGSVAVDEAAYAEAAAGALSREEMMRQPTSVEEFVWGVESWLRPQRPGYEPPALDAATLEAMRAELAELRRRWNALAPGESLELPFQTARRSTCERPARVDAAPPERSHRPRR